jgi:arsenite-transporting ATPase
MRIILYTGKGGVGKTSVSAATALLCANRGYRTLVMSTDAAHSLGDSLDMRLRGDATEVAQNLWAQELDVYHEIDVHWGTLQGWLRAIMAWRGIDEIIAEEMAVLPGMEELAGLLYLTNYYEKSDYDVVIVDCAPTGETLRLLSFPDVLRWWMERIFPIQRAAAKVVRPVLKRLTSMPLPEEAVYQAAVELFARLDQMHQILTTPDVASVRLVLNPEKMVIKEAQRTFTYLNLYGYGTDQVICNRLIPDGVADPYFVGWRAAQRRHFTEIEEGFAPLPIFTAPLMDQEVVGLGMLERLGNAIYADRDPSQISFRGQAQAVEQTEAGYILTLATPFTEKEELDVMQVGDELVVRIGNQRRNILLPRVLVGLDIAEAKLADEELKIRFEKAVERGKNE